MGSKTAQTSHDKPTKTSSNIKKAEDDGKNKSTLETKTKTKKCAQSEYSISRVAEKVLFWGESNDASIEKLWSRLPSWLGTILVSAAVFLLGISARGEWFLFLVYFFKFTQSDSKRSGEEAKNFEYDGIQDFLNHRFHGFWTILIYSTAISYIIYFGVGGFIHWYYYVRQRNNPKAWKCQPEKWLSKDLELHEIKYGCLGLVFGSFLSAALSSYILNGGETKMYFELSKYGYLWLLLQGPIVYIWNDYLTYWHHRMYHTPFLYKNFHKLHHTYKQPTAFSVTAIHPFEFVHMQCVLISPIFIFPVYWLVYCLILAYTYYHGIIDHSGVNFKRHWWQPWQPDCIFHDNHHQYFHVNFGFNMELWDKLHGTYRRKDRIYDENIFYGFGKPLEKASMQEILNDINERKSENPLAYPENVHTFNLSQKDIENNFKKCKST